VLMLFSTTLFGLLGVVASGVRALVPFGVGFAVRTTAAIAVVALFVIFGLVLKNTGLPGLPAAVVSSYTAPAIQPPTIPSAPAAPAQGQ